MNDNCVCGFHPPEEPNLDCERCQLICKLIRLRERAKAVVDDAAYEDHVDACVAHVLIEALRAELENDDE